MTDTLFDWGPTHEVHRLEAFDGTGLHVETVGEGDEIVLLANGLGGRLYAYGPLVERFAPTHRMVTWDYRGLFDSDHPPSRRKLAIAHHTEDHMEGVDAILEKRAPVFKGA